MEDIQKKKIYDSLNQILQSGISGLDEEIQILSFQPYYAIDGTSGMKFTAKLSYVELSLFAGFSNDSKYENQLLFGVLKSEVDRKAEKSCTNTDSNGNRIYAKLKIDEKFISSDETTQQTKIEKWLRSKTESLLEDCEMFDYAHERSYDNVGLMSWLAFVELPWLLFVGSSIWMCYLMFDSENMTFEKIPIPCLVIFYGGVLAILLTLKFRFNVKKAKNLKFNLFKPYTWSVSKTAKVYFCVAFCFMFVAPLIWRIVKWILLIPVRIISDPCDNCGAYFSTEIIGSEKLGTKSGYETVTRHDVTRNSSGERLYTTDRQEQVHMTTTYYIEHCRCKKCDYEWDRKKSIKREG